MKKTIRLLTVFAVACSFTLFSCDTPTGNNIPVTTGSSTTSNGSTGNNTSSNGNGESTSNGGTANGSGGSSASSGSSSSSGSSGSGTGVAFSTTYTEPTLPNDVDSDPFAGHTYGTSSNYCSFGTDPNNSSIKTLDCGNLKFQYTYDGRTNKKLLALKRTHYPINNISYTFSEFATWLQTATPQDLGTTEAQFTQVKQQLYDYIKWEFETIHYQKAELNASNQLQVRDAFTEVPANIRPHNGYITFNSASPTLQLTINNTMTTNLGSIWRTDSSNNSLIFTITNISSTIITASTTSDPSITLNLRYSMSLNENDYALIVTLTGEDNATISYLNSIGATPQSDPSLQLSSPTTYSPNQILNQQS